MRNPVVPPTWPSWVDTDAIWISSAGCIVTYLQDFLEAGEDAANLLDMEEKLAILAAARRKVKLPLQLASCLFWSI